KAAPAFVLEYLRPVPGDPLPRLVVGGDAAGNVVGGNADRLGKGRPGPQLLCIPGVKGLSIEYGCFSRGGEGQLRLGEAPARLKIYRLAPCVDIDEDAPPADKEVGLRVVGAGEDDCIDRPVDG